MSKPSSIQIIAIPRSFCESGDPSQADMPYDFFLSRYNEAYVEETIQFCQSLVNDTPVPCTGSDGLIALIMAQAADLSAEEGRWVKFSEVVQKVYCETPTQCDLMAESEVLPQGFRPSNDPRGLLLPDVDQQKKEGGLMNAIKKMIQS